MTAVLVVIAVKRQRISAIRRLTFFVALKHNGYHYMKVTAMKDFCEKL